jgi:Tfp pilus assembly protein PilW
MMVTLISSFVFAGVLSAYIFLGRSLARQVNAEGLESRARLALYYFTQDLSAASTITASNPGAYTTGTQITLTIPGSTIAYACDWSLGNTAGKLTRTVNSNPALTLLTNLSSFSFGYDDMTGSVVTAPSSPPSSPQINIKQAYMVFTSTAGYAQSGAASEFTVVSPRVILKNRTVLTDPNKP